VIKLALLCVRSERPSGTTTPGRTTAPAGSMSLRESTTSCGDCSNKCRHASDSRSAASAVRKNSDSKFRASSSSIRRRSSGVSSIGRPNFDIANGIPAISMFDSSASAVLVSPATESAAIRTSLRPGAATSALSTSRFESRSARASRCTRSSETSSTSPGSPRASSSWRRRASTCAR